MNGKSANNERIKHIAKRWWKDQIRWIVIGAGIVSVIMGYLGAIIPIKQIFLRLCLTFSGMLVTGIYILILNWRTRDFARKLSVEERTVLAEVAARGYEEEHVIIRMLLRTSGINPKMELLRPSEKKDDNTLLRATTQTDDTAQEQLLRPTQNDTGRAVE